MPFVKCDANKAQTRQEKPKALTRVERHNRHTFTAADAHEGHFLSMSTCMSRERSWLRESFHTTCVCAAVWLFPRMPAQVRRET